MSSPLPIPLRSGRVHEAFGPLSAAFAAVLGALGIARQSGRDARVNLDEILRRGVREGIILIVAGKMLARC